MPNALTAANMLEIIPAATRPKILASLRANNASHVVRYMCVDMCSSRFGSTAYLLVGGTCSLSLVDALAWHLGDLPSQRQYPQDYCSAPDLIPLLEATIEQGREETETQQRVAALYADRWGRPTQRRPRKGKR